jgi:tetratricopeptide (TPR) repeat protein
MHYRITLDERQGYAPAYAGLARLALAAKDYPKAISYYLQADSSLNDYSFKEELAGVYQVSGQHDKAATLENKVIEGLSEDSRSGQNDESIGHYADRELAYAWLKKGDYDRALEHALLEYNRRPENIDVNETLAWVLYNKGDYAKALPYVGAALRTGNRNPVVLCHAGLIYAANGKKAEARAALQGALALNADIPMDLKEKCLHTLKTL